MRIPPASRFLKACAAALAALVLLRLAGARAADLRIEAADAGMSQVRVSWEWLPEAPPAWRLWRLDPGRAPHRAAESGAVHAGSRSASGEALEPLSPSQPAPRFLMEWEEADGETRAHGPFMAAPPEFPVPDADPDERGAGRPRAAPAGGPTPAGGAPEPRPLASLRVSRTGIYRVPADGVAAALGVDAATVRGWFLARLVRFAIGGIPVPAWSGPGGSNIWMHVPPTESPYFDGDVIQMIGLPGSAPVERAAPPKPGAPGRIGQSALALEQNLVALPNAPGPLDSDIWMWEILAAGHPVFGRRTYPFVPPGVPSPAGAGTLQVELLSTSEAHHLVDIQLNSVTVSSLGWDGRDARRAVVALPAGLLVAGTNRLSLTNRGDRTSTVYVNRFLIGHPRVLSASDGFLTFDALGDGPVSVDGFSTNRLEAWDISEGLGPVRLTGLAAARTDTGWEVSFQSASGRRYAVFDPDGAPAVTQVRSVEPRVLSAPTNGVDYLAVVPSGAWLPALQPLLDHRRNQGLRVRAVTLAAVQDEFAAGRPLPSALQELARAARTWGTPPRYILLVGDGTYDYRGFAGFTDNILPPMQALTALGRFPTDIGLADADGDGLWEAGVGRLPVTTPAELAVWIGKLKAYEGQALPLRARHLLLADFPDAAGQFIADSELLRASLEPVFEVETLYNAANSIEAVRSGIGAALGREPVVWNYAGHGARDRLGNGYVVAADVPALPATQVPPWLVAMTCGAGHFGVPGFDAIAEQLLRRTDGGAIAVWSPSGFSQNASARLLNQALVDALVDSPPRPRLGDLARSALSGYAKLGGDPQLPRLYNLIGDPATRLRLGPGTAPDPVLLTIEPPTATDLTLRWTGGAPPYHVERAGRLEGLEWVEVLETSVPSARLPRPARETYFRVRTDP